MNNKTSVGDVLIKCIDKKLFNVLALQEVNTELENQIRDKLSQYENIQIVKTDPLSISAKTFGLIIIAN